MKVHAMVAVVAALILSLFACSASQPYVWVSRYGQQEEEPEWRLGPGDVISVLVADQPKLSGTFTLGADGRYVQPVVGTVALGGLTLAQANAQLAASLKGILVRPQVTVSLTTRRPIVISVLGEVKAAGRFEVPYDEGVLSLLSRAGGLTEFADRDSIYVVRRRPSLLRIRFRFRDLAAPDVVASSFRLLDGDVIVVE